MPSPKASELSNPIRLGDVVIDPRSRAILRGNAPPAKLEPKVFEVLLYLMERHGEVVTRSELMDRVWQRMAVSDEVLSRSISRLRKYLGDDRRKPRFIQTIPKTGYRLLPAPVAMSADAAHARRPFRLSRMASVAAVLAVIAFAISLIYSGSDATLEQPVRIGVFPIRPEPPTADAELLARSFADLIAVRLDELPGIETRSSSFMGDALEIVGDTGSVLAGGGLSYAITGTLAPSSDRDRAVLKLELLELRAAADLGRVPIGTYEMPYLDSQYDLDALVTVREAVAARLAKVLRTHLPAVDGSSPGDFEAYRLILHAQAELDEVANCGLGAEAMLHRALEHDPQSARAYSMLGDAYWMQVWDCGRGRSTAERALRAFDRALELDPGELSAAYMKAGVLTEMGRAEDAYALLDALADEHPERIELLYACMFVLRYAGLLDESTAVMERILARDPLALTIEMTEMPNNLLYAGKWRRYLQTAPALNIPYMNYYRAYAHWRLGETARALELLDEVAGMNVGGVFVDYSLALRAHLRGDNARARRIVLGRIEERRAFDSIDGEMLYKEAQLLAITGDIEGALARARRALELGFFCVACYAEEPSFEALAAHPEMRSIVAEARQRQDAFRARMRAM